MPLNLFGRPLNTQPVDPALLEEANRALFARARLDNAPVGSVPTQQTAPEQGAGQDAFSRWLALYNARNAAQHDPAAQAHLGPLEHGAFAESAVSENPLMALPLLFATPAYSAAKALGLHPSRTGSGIDEMAEAYRGIGRGLAGYL